MARLFSEDTECVSSLEIVRDDSEEPSEMPEEQTWQSVRIALVSGSRSLGEKSPVCREPQDEIELLVNLLSDLVGRRRDSLSFEPAEPSFELNFARTREGGIKAEAWIDSGNASTGFYRWDATGIRFYTTDQLLDSFKNELESEFLRKS